MGYLHHLQRLDLEGNEKFMDNNNWNEVVRRSSARKTSKEKAEPARILILEDNHIFANGLVHLLDTLRYRDVTVCKSYEEALKAVQGRDYDIVLSDIRLADENSGLDFAQYIRSFSAMPIVFLSEDFSEGVYEQTKSFHPSLFLKKQFSPLELRQALELLLTQQESRKSDKLTSTPINTKENLGTDLSNGFFVKKGKHFKRLFLHEIDLIESDRNYSTLKTGSDQSYIIAMPLSELEAVLKPYGFVRVHRSFIVNWAKIHSINVTENILIVNERQVDIGKSYKNDVYDRLNKLPS